MSNSCVLWPVNQLLIIYLTWTSDSNGETGDARDFLDSLGIDSKRYSELDPSTVKMRAAGRLKLG